MNEPHHDLLQNFGFHEDLSKDFINVLVLEILSNSIIFFIFLSVYCISHFLTPIFCHSLYEPNVPVTATSLPRPNFPPFVLIMAAVLRFFLNIPHHYKCFVLCDELSRKAYSFKKINCLLAY